MKTILIYSGGLDSTTLLYELLSSERLVKALSVNYGQRHKKELQHAARICERLGVEHRIVDLPIGELLSSSLTRESIEVPEGHYADENMKLTVVPNRNMIMLSVAIGYCVSEKFDTVAYAAHAGDHAIYPDCRPEFVVAMQTVAKLCDWHHVELEAPFLAFSKGDIAKRGSELGVPFEETWTCYKGLDKHCGKCGACVERREAFELAEVEDPTDYA